MRNSKWQIIAVAALGLALIASPASATSRPGKTNPAGKKNGTTTANGPVAVLHQAQVLLATANHDYDGHRAKAAHHVALAIRELGGHNQGQAANGGGNGGNPVREPQAQSDAQLQKALQLLNGLRGQLPNTPNGMKAAANIQAAINELNTALKIR
jgi:hypothetical protein